MAGSKLIVKLTPDQQKQIKDATGKNITELKIHLAATGEITEERLAGVSGGGGDMPSESISLNFPKIEW